MTGSIESVTHTSEHNAQVLKNNTDALVALFARVALAAAFLSAVASRFGLWHHQPARERFAEFIRYTAAVNSFLPAAVIPAVAWMATVAETSLGILLLLGFWRKWTAVGACALLILFGTAMAISAGIKSPLDYSVFSAAAAAALLATRESR